MSFKYARFSKLCYYCGKLDHIQKDCVALMEELECGNNPVLQYNDSLKTKGLGHVIPMDVNMPQKSNNKTLSRIAMEHLDHIPRHHVRSVSLTF